MLRYDATCDDWLLSTSEGLYQLKTLDGIPSKVSSAPPISVMGLNAWEKNTDGNWRMVPRKDTIPEDFLSRCNLHKQIQRTPARRSQEGTY